MWVRMWDSRSFCTSWWRQKWCGHWTAGSPPPSHRSHHVPSSPSASAAPQTYGRQPAGWVCGASRSGCGQSGRLRGAGTVGRRLGRGRRLGWGCSAVSPGGMRGLVLAAAVGWCRRARRLDPLVPGVARRGADSGVCLPLPHLLLGNTVLVGEAGEVLDCFPLYLPNFQIWKFEFIPRFLLVPCHPQEGNSFYCHL